MVAAVRVGIARGSMVVRLRPVGKTSRRPRVGAPAGPGATRRPSRAASKAALSRVAQSTSSSSICAADEGAGDPFKLRIVASQSAARLSASGARPNTWRRSLMARSLMSQSCASSFATASRGASLLVTPQSCARPDRHARSRISASSSVMRLRSTPSASAYSSISPSSSAMGP